MELTLLELSLYGLLWADFFAEILGCLGNNAYICTQHKDSNHGINDNE